MKLTTACSWAAASLLALSTTTTRGFSPRLSPTGVGLPGGPDELVVDGLAAYGAVLVGDAAHAGRLVVRGGCAWVSDLKCEGDPASRVAVEWGSLYAQRLAVTNGSCTLVGGTNGPATLTLSGSAVFSGGLLVLPGGTLAGWGTVAGAVANYGTIAPGAPGLVFTNGGGFASVVTNYGAVCCTNGSAVFAGVLVNRAAPEVVAGWGWPPSLAVRTVGGVRNWVEWSPDMRSWAWLEDLPGDGGVAVVGGEALPRPPPGFVRAVAAGTGGGQ